MDYECYRALFERSLSVLPPIERRVFMKRMMQVMLRTGQVTGHCPE